jgi:hypothetical protein
VVNSGPIETTGVYPMYFPELVMQVDGTTRTLADRGHRAVSGYLAGGFYAFLMAGKYPDLVSSASSFLGPTEYSVGPKGFDTEYNLEDFYQNYEAVRTRLVTESGHSLRFYHRRLNDFWKVARDGHETEHFDSTECTPELPKTFDFHMNAFAHPSPAPAAFHHADAYPNFTVWGWEVASARRRPGVTILENASITGFRSAVREWMPGGALMPDVKLSVASAPVYPPNSSHMVTYLRLRDGFVRRSPVRADAHGRVNFELDGDAYQVGISASPLVTMTGYEIMDAAWATSGEPVKLQARFANVGAGPSRPMDIRWEAPDEGVAIDPGASHLGALAPGESAVVTVTFKSPDPKRTFLRFAANLGAAHVPGGVALFPHADATKVFQIADGKSAEVMRRGVSTAVVELGEGNGDGHAAPGETFAVLIPDGEFLRAAELITNDPCLDVSVRASDNWTDYDHSGASAKYSLAKVRKDCEPGYVMHVLARVLLPRAPDHQPWYLSLEIPVWYRAGEEPK